MLAALPVVRYCGPYIDHHIHMSIYHSQYHTFIRVSSKRFIQHSTDIPVCTSIQNTFAARSIKYHRSSTIDHRTVHIDHRNLYVINDTLDS